MNRSASGSRTPSALRSLARAVARRCRGRTLVLGRAFPELLERLASRGIEALARPLDALGPFAGASERRVESGPTVASESFDTVLLFGAIEYESRDEALALLRRAWSLVGTEGKLLACVPNGDHVEDPDVVQRFTRRSLKQLLKTIDQPKMFTDQPYRWLLMGLDTDPRVDRVTQERHRVIAGLCRGRVLELGCAAGHLCNSIADRGCGVEGVDKNAAKIAKARRLFPDIDFRQKDMLELPAEPRYDTVVLAEVLEHVPEEIGARMLAKAWDLVASPGRLIVSVPNEDCVRHANHLKEFTESEFIEMLELCGPPKAVADQPFKWLLAYVDRPA